MNASAKRRRLSIESLEARSMLSATPTVTGKIVGGYLQLTGNNANCSLLVTEPSAGTYQITGLNGTQIKVGNATGTTESISGVSGGLNINLPGAGGLQEAVVSAADIRGSVNINIGKGPSEIGVGLIGFIGGTGPVTVRGNLNINTAGGDSIVVENSLRVLQNNNINLGPGNRTIDFDLNDDGPVFVKTCLNINAIGAGTTDIEISPFTEEVPDLVRKPALTVKSPELTVGNDFNINIGKGTLNAVLEDLIVGNNLNLTCAQGQATINLRTVEVHNNANITTGAGADTVNFNGFQSRQINLSTGAGSDSVTLLATTTTVGTNLDGGSGADTITYLGGGNSLAHKHLFGWEVIA